MRTFDVEHDGHRLVCTVTQDDLSHSATLEPYLTKGGAVFVENRAAVGREKVLSLYRRADGIPRVGATRCSHGRDGWFECGHG